MPRSLTAWGIDVGAAAVRALKLRREGAKVHLEAMEVIEHRHFLNEPDANRQELVRESLAKLLQRHPLRGEMVFVSVASSNSFARFVKLPPVEPRKIPDIVHFEAIQQIPFPLDQVIWDYHTFQSADNPDVEIGIFAIKTEVIDGVLEDFQSLGITVHGVQIAPLAIYNTLRHEQRAKDKGTIVLDLGAEHTDLLILDQGRLWLRHINLGGNSFTELLARGFRLPFQKAETLKRNAASSKWARQIFQAIRPNFADMVTEIQRSIGYYNSAHRESRLEQMLGVGNSFRLANLQKYLQQYLHMPVNRLDGFNRLEVSDTKLTAALPDRALGMSVAYGLALQAVGLGVIVSNLLPPAVARRILWRSKTPWFTATAALFVLGAIAAGAKYYANYSAFDVGISNPRLVTAQQQIQAAQDLLNKYNAVTDTSGTSMRESQAYLHLTHYRTLWPEMLNALYGALPQASTQAAKRGADWSLVIQNMDITYAANLTGGGGQAGAASNAGFQGGIPGPGGQPIPGAGNAAPAASVAGFRWEITGYTLWKNPFEIMEFFRDTLNHVVSPTPGQPFHFTVEPGSLITEPIGGNAGENNVRGNGGGGYFQPWGAHPGPFAGVFLRDFYPPAKPPGTPAGTSNPLDGRDQLGLEGQAPFNAPGAGLQASRSALNQGLINPDTHQPLGPATAFHLTLLVDLDMGTAPTSAAALTRPVGRKTRPSQPGFMRRSARPNLPPFLGRPGGPPPRRGP